MSITQAPPSLKILAQNVTFFPVFVPCLSVSMSRALPSRFKNLPPSTNGFPTPPTLTPSHLGAIPFFVHESGPALFGKNATACYRSSSPILEYRLPSCNAQTPPSSRLWPCIPPSFSSPLAVQCLVHHSETPPSS